MKVDANNTHIYKHIFHAYIHMYLCVWVGGRVGGWVCVCNMRVASHIEFGLLIQSITLDTTTMDHDRLL
jgi:hypothetical protein